MYILLPKLLELIHKLLNIFLQLETNVQKSSNQNKIPQTDFNSLMDFWAFLRFMNTPNKTKKVVFHIQYWALKSQWAKLRV